MNQQMMRSQLGMDMQSSHSRLVALLLAIFMGFWGVHRLYVGRYLTAALWFFTGGLFGFGWIFDVVMIAIGRFRDSEDRVLGEVQHQMAVGQRPQYQALPQTRQPMNNPNPQGEIDFTDVDRDPLEDKFAALEEEMKVGSRR
jgi:TM2 domain-containing membrane protein YozV